MGGIMHMGMTCDTPLFSIPNLVSGTEIRGRKSYFVFLEFLSPPRRYVNQSHHDVIFMGSLSLL